MELQNVVIGQSVRDYFLNQQSDIRAEAAMPGSSARKQLETEEQFVSSPWLLPRTLGDQRWPYPEAAVAGQKEQLPAGSQKPFAGLCWDLNWDWLKEEIISRKFQYD